MAGWHHWLDAHGFGWTLGVGDGQGGLACCDSWGRRELAMTERLNWTELVFYLKDNCFTEFCGFLSCINKNQPQVWPSPSAPLWWSQSPVCAPCLTQQIALRQLFFLPKGFSFWINRFDFKIFVTPYWDYLGLQHYINFRCGKLYFNFWDTTACLPPKLLFSISYHMVNHLFFSTHLCVLNLFILIGG